MGKKTDKMYITHTEWAVEWGGKKKDLERGRGGALPFFCCAIALQPFTDPYCTNDGIVYDSSNIFPYLQKHGKDPATGKPMKPEDLFKVHFHKSSTGEFHSPATFKVFTEFTHIVAIRTSGHVYSMDDIEKLNIKPKNWTCLVTGEPFTKEDIITIQDPSDPHKRKFAEFHHIKERLKAEEESNDPAKNIHATAATQRILAQIKSKNEEKEKQQQQQSQNNAQPQDSDTPKEKEPEKDKPKPADTKKKLPPKSAYESAAFTCAGFTPAPESDEMKPKITKKKGYVRLVTNLGPLNFELACDQIPLATENFLKLCESGYYNNVVFHRLIPDFMVQGGDPTGSGKGGESIWKKPFKDEFKPQLLHNARGILSMANHGPHTNGSQFFITFRQTPHLNNKHTVFGRLVGGMETLNLMETIPADEQDRPKKPIMIKEAIIFVNPFSAEEMEKEKEEEKQKEIERLKRAGTYQDPNDPRGAWFSNPAPVIRTNKSGVGKYINAQARGSAPAPSDDDAGDNGGTVPAKRKTIDFVDQRTIDRGEKHAKRAEQQFEKFANW